MKIHKAYKFRIYPTIQQQSLFNQTFGCCRLVWNKVLDWRSKKYLADKSKVNWVAAINYSTTLKKDFVFLKEVSSDALQQTIRNQEAAFSNFFAKRANYPTFKKKDGHQSFRLTDHGFRFRDGKLFVAKSKEPIKVNWSRNFKTDPSQCTISKTPSGKYFVSFLVEEDIEELPKIEKTIGIDLGLTDFAITSDGEKIKPLKVFRKFAAKLKRYQRVLARKKKGSANRNKQRIKVARIHERIANTRKDFLHKLSTKLIRENQSIALEDLNVSGMLKNHKLSKSISDASWYAFVEMLKYKASWYGREIRQVSPWFPSTQLCSSCGSNTGKKALSIREWKCVNCGIFHDRDINAAKNINTMGHIGIKACGQPTVGVQRPSDEALDMVG